jgi:hypothetical protein
MTAWRFSSYLHQRIDPRHALIGQSRETFFGEGGVAFRSFPAVSQAQKPYAITSDKSLILLARSERFELPTLGFEVRCSIQLSYERVPGSITRLGGTGPAGCRRPCPKQPGRVAAPPRSKKQQPRDASVGGRISCRRACGGPGRDRPPRSVRSARSTDHHNRRRCRARAPARNCGDS